MGAAGGTVVAREQPPARRMRLKCAGNLKVLG